ncbi:tRNA lysidine(34) synthetase TilS [Motiliproteus sp. SC1-56]|uniref:tRNA lysidine(34) synthetase TilS n=1 Tax=Motiliproteus sp. SC1-56 TaxID=2799565 RepID=UPI001A8FECD0|nr:tRNA lysidine(34) synthetase TilS [Motiliproteus sp. SC1-56]
MIPTVADLQQQLQGLGDLSGVWVAYSGGLDSQVLLHLAAGACAARRLPLRALHIHHGLHPAADCWQAHCEAQCRVLGVPLTTVRVEVAAQGSTEAQAREARYRAFEERLGDGELLLMAHHADDQLETLLLRLLRGAGVRGLAAMPAQRSLGDGRLLRPLLAWTRQQLETYARQHRLCWVEDPSNRETDYDRNYLRQEVVPQLRARWPAVATLASRSAALCAESEALLQALAEEDLACAQAPLGGLCLAGILSLSRGRQKLLLRSWIEQQGVRLPTAALLARILDEVVPARPDAEPLLQWDGIELRRYQGALYLKSPWPAPPDTPRAWQPERALETPAGTLRAEPTLAGGFGWPPGATLAVAYRRGGERLRLPGREGSRALKKLLQAAAVPPWLRDWLPLIYVDGTLAAVADLWICEGFQAGPGTPSVRLQWQPRPILATG